MRTWSRKFVPLGVFVLALAAVCPSAHATARMSFTIVPADFAEPIRVELVLPSGATQVIEPTETQFAVQPEGEPGTYRMNITAGDTEGSAEVEVPRYGVVNVTYDTLTPEDRIKISTTAEIEQITVTARRVEEPLQKAPVAITALSQTDLDNSYVTNIHKLALVTPNLYMEKNTGTSSGGKAAIRGIGEDESFFTSDTPVGIYIDDVYIPRQTGAMFDLYQTERVEVLRGPQGTLYGRNTSAGAIKIVTVQPENEFHLNVEGELGNYDRIGVRALVGVPVTDKFAFQLAGMVRNHKGFDENLYNGDDVNDQDIWGARASLRFFPTDRWDILVVGDVLRERSTPGYPLGFVPQPPYINGFGVGLPNFDEQLDGDTDAHTLLSDVTDPLNDLDQEGAYARVSWQASDNLTLKSITSWRSMSNLLFLDADGQVGNQFLPGVIPEFLPLFHLYQDQNQDQFSQELQLLGTIGNSIDYVGGIYYFNENNDQITENVVLAPFGANRYTDVDLTTDSIAGFASFDFRLLENLTLTAGGRYTEDTKDFDIIAFNPDGSQLIACVAPDGSVVSSRTPCTPDAPPGSVDTPVQKQLKETWSRFTPRLALSWSASPTVLAYLDISAGFKSGAFDGRANEGSTILPLEPIPPEDILNYEIGIKSDLLNRLWRLNVAAFFTQFDDLQGTGTDPAGNFRRFSIGDAEIKGLEVETIVVPANGFQLIGNLGLLDTEFTKINFDQAIDCAPYGTGDIDLKLKYAPETSYRIGALYSTPNRIAGGYWTFGANYSYKSELYLGSCNAGCQTQVGYGLVDATVAYEIQEGRWRFSLNGDNLTDEDYITGVFAFPGLNSLVGYIGAPRTVTANVRYQY